MTCSDHTKEFLHGLGYSAPSAINAAEALIQLACESGLARATAQQPHEILLQTKTGPSRSHYLPDGFAVFRMVLARIATICLHAPTLEWSQVPFGQLPVSFLQLKQYLINIDESAPQYFRATFAEGAQSLYQCESRLLVRTKDNDLPLLVRVINTTSVQSFEGTVLATGDDRQSPK